MMQTHSRIIPPAALLTVAMKTISKLLCSAALALVIIDVDVIDVIVAVASVMLVSVIVDTVIVVVIVVGAGSILSIVLASFGNAMIAPFAATTECHHLWLLPPKYPKVVVVSVAGSILSTAVE